MGFDTDKQDDAALAILNLTVYGGRRIWKGARLGNHRCACMKRG